MSKSQLPTLGACSCRLLLPASVAFIRRCRCVVLQRRHQTWARLPRSCWSSFRCSAISCCCSGKRRRLCRCGKWFPLHSWAREQLVGTAHRRCVVPPLPRRPYTVAAVTAHVCHCVGWPMCRVVCARRGHPQLLLLLLLAVTEAHTQSSQLQLQLPEKDHHAGQQGEGHVGCPRRFPHLLRRYHGGMAAWGA